MRQALQPQALPRGSLWVSILSPGEEETPPQSSGALFYCRRSPAFEREPWPFRAGGQRFANNGLLSLRGGLCVTFLRDILAGSNVERKSLNLPAQWGGSSGCLAVYSEGREMGNHEEGEIQSQVGACH